jgi:flagellar protein FlgJ
MDIATQYADVYTDFQGLAGLRAESGKNDPETLRKIAGQFEALFIQMMLKSMRDASLGEGLMDSEHVKTYQSMFDQQIALDLSKRSSLGLADMMVRQLSPRGGTPSGAQQSDMASGAAMAPVPGLFMPAARPPRGDAAETGGLDRGTVEDWRPETPEGFVEQLWPHAQRAADQLGTAPELLIAQAALETGWGQHMIHHQDGRNSFNLFGIKADAHWQGARAVTETVEFRDGLMRRERAPFRAYDSLADSFSDYVSFLKSNPRYRQALDQANDAPAFARALAEAGYATDPDYHGKIEQIMDSSRMRDAVSGARSDQSDAAG